MVSLKKVIACAQLELFVKPNCNGLIGRDFLSSGNKQYSKSLRKTDELITGR